MKVIHVFLLVVLHLAFVCDERKVTYLWQLPYAEYFAAGTRSTQNMPTSSLNLLGKCQTQDLPIEKRYRHFSMSVLSRIKLDKHFSFLVSA